MSTSSLVANENHFVKGVPWRHERVHSFNKGVVHVSDSPQHTHAHKLGCWPRLSFAEEVGGGPEMAYPERAYYCWGSVRRLWNDLLLLRKWAVGLKWLTFVEEVGGRPEMAYFCWGSGRKAWNGLLLLRKCGDGSLTFVEEVRDGSKRANFCWGSVRKLWKGLLLMRKCKAGLKGLTFDEEVWGCYERA